MAECNVEDKKCRICGFADEKNINIFKGNKSQTLLTKILSVYPIVLYENDPLPKHICKKCIFNVTFMYNDMQRVLKIHSTWINNVKCVQPQHNYIRVLDLIGNSNRITRETIKTKFGEETCERTINRLLILGNVDTITSSAHVNSKSKTTPESATNFHSMAEFVGPVKSISEHIDCNSFQSVGKNNPASGSSSALIKNETNKLFTPPPLIVKCRYCPLQFNTLEMLAIHQITHMRLTIPKIFAKKYLNKSVRRGRLITVENRKCIRCLNCWRIFEDNKTILNHWTLGECDFYCQICGKEFAQTPKMLRDHIPAAHDISYRLLRAQMNNAKISTKGLHLHRAHPVSTSQQCLPVVPTNTNAYSTTILATAPTTNIKSTAKCKICLQVFRNVKALNSHMRKHKPSYAYGALQPSSDIDVYASEENCEVNCNTSLQSTNFAPVNVLFPKHTARTNFVQPSGDLGLIQKSSIKVRSLSDLQKNFEKQTKSREIFTITEFSNDFNLNLHGTACSTLTAQTQLIKQEPRE